MKTEVNIAVPSRRSMGKRGTAYVLLALFALVGCALVPGCGRCDATDFSLQLDVEAGGGAVGGGGLGLAGVLFQQVLRNPLTEPSTLGGGQWRAISASVCR